MMGHRQVEQAALFYEFSFERHVPAEHLLRSIDRFVELGELRRELAAFYSTMGRPSIDPELMIRMLIIGYCFGIRSERRRCEEVHLNLETDFMSCSVSASKVAFATGRSLISSAPLK
jgi:transposase